MKTLTSALIGVALLMSTALVAQSTNTVTVTPFVNLSAQPSDDWIGAGIAETVASDLERRGMTVVGEESGALWRVVGAYQRMGDLVRITARLIETETGAVHQSGTVDGTLTDLFELQDEREHSGKRLDRKAEAKRGREHLKTLEGVVWWEDCEEKTLYEPFLAQY